jgi:hypothetical protein
MPDKKTQTAVQKTILRVRRGEVKDLKAEAAKFGTAFKKPDLVEVLKEYEFPASEDDVIEQLESFFRNMSEVGKPEPPPTPTPTADTIPISPGNTEKEPKKRGRKPKSESPSETTPTTTPTDPNKITAKTLKEPPRTESEREFEKANGKLYMWTIAKLQKFFESQEDPVKEENVKQFLDGLGEDGHPRWMRYNDQERAYLTNFLLKKVTGLNRYKGKDGTLYSFRPITPDKPEKPVPTFDKPKNQDKNRDLTGDNGQDESEDTEEGTPKEKEIESVADR